MLDETILFESDALVEAIIDGATRVQEVALAETGHYVQEMPESVNGLTTRTDVYDGPRGQGYDVFSSQVIDGVEYTKIDSVGPESEWRTYDWTPVKPDGDV